MINKKPFYITTPIYYPSAKLHIGNAYTTVAADALARYKRLTGYDVMFLTGTDEHGQKIQRLAEAKKVTPKAYVDEIVADIKELWDILNISYDKFIRTTDEEHIVTVKTIFEKLYEQGDIYKSSYEGLYCTPCESFWSEGQLVDGKCPDCNRSVEKAKEEAYFFRMSKYAPRLIEYIETHPDFIQPESRKNEMLNNFLRPGLQDLCVSRTTFNWGIPVEFDKGHVVYVWIDALSNYISVLGYANNKDNIMDKYWPADLHLIGKDILRFHTIYWPILLMALDLPLPKQIFGHGWLMLEDGKMSKSKGNIVKPEILVNHFGVDSVRYYLLHEIPFGSDGIFNNEIFIKKTNSDLANDLGNLVSRTVTMIDKYFSSEIPTPDKREDIDDELIILALETPIKVENSISKLKIPGALDNIWELIRRTNKYIDETQPWVLGKDETQKPRLATVLYNLVESLRFTSVLLSAFLPDTSNKINEQLGITEIGYDSLTSFNGTLPNTKVNKNGVIFPRIDVEEKLKELQKISEEQKKIANAINEASQENKGSEKEESHNNFIPIKDEITIEDFEKIDLRIAKVLECEYVKKSDKLLKLKVDIGGEVKQVISGIAKFYKAEDLIGKKVIMVVNLKKVKLRGELSEGMILSAAAEDDSILSITTALKDVPEGLIVR